MALSAIVKRKIRLLALLAAGLLALTGCGQEEQAPSTAPAAATTPVVTVRFLAGGQVVSEQRVETGACPAAVEPALEGLTVAGWQDAAGRTVTPEETAVTADTDYTALAYPDLSNHEPYLFPEENGLIRPEDALLADEFAQALYVLAAEGAQRYFPGIPAGPVEITAGQLRQVLAHFFPQEALEASLAGLDGDASVTRGDFARIMNPLLGRGAGETVILSDDTGIPMDLGTDRQDYADVLEACLAHSPADEGQPLEEAVWELRREPGFFNLGGWLYYAGETGAIVRDTDIGRLHFGPDGRYTCGDGELDALVADILAEIISQNPEGERIDWLRSAFEYSRDSFFYLRKDPIAFGATGWEIEYAKTMLTGGHGNCYNYAAVFWALARGLGYDARAISGTMTVTNQPHSWVEIEMDGQPYIFDPEEEMAYRTKRDIFDKDMFMVTYAEGVYWDYVRPEE